MIILAELASQPLINRELGGKKTNNFPSLSKKSFIFFKTALHANSNIALRKRNFPKWSTNISVKSKSDIDRNILIHYTLSVIYSLGTFSEHPVRCTYIFLGGTNLFPPYSSSQWFMDHSVRYVFWFYMCICTHVMCQKLSNYLQRQLMDNRLRKKQEQKNRL